MNNKPKLSIFYQFNPWRSSIGGIQTFICSFLKYAPPEFEVRLIGTGGNDAAIGKWTEKEFAGRAIKFLPVIKVEDDDVRHLIPTTLRYTSALPKYDLSSDFMHFNRLEPALAAYKWQGEKTFFMHNDLQKQMNAKQGNNAILWQKFPSLYFALESRLIQQFDWIYSCHTETAQFYQEKYPAIAARVSYLKNTVDEEIFYALDFESKRQRKKALAQEMGLSQSTKFVLFAGRLHPQKDPLLLIEAFALLDKTNVHLLIAGAGELKSAIEAKVAQHGLTGQVTLLGAVPQAMLAGLHQLSDVFVLSSVYEGLPLTVLEALSCGTPVVTTNSGETPNFLSVDSGIVCEKRTPKAISNALDQVLENPTQYSSANCVLTAKPYSAKTVVGRVYQDMYERWEYSNAAGKFQGKTLSLASK